MNLIWIAIYITGYIFAWRKAFMVAIDELSFSRIEPSDIIMSCLLATLTSIIWPLWLIPIMLYRLLVKKNLEAWIERNYK